MILKGLGAGHVIKFQMDVRIVIQRSQAKAFEKKKPSFPNTVTSVNPHCGCRYANKCFFGNLVYAVQED